MYIGGSAVLGEWVLIVTCPPVTFYVHCYAVYPYVSRVQVLLCCGVEVWFPRNTKYLSSDPATPTLHYTTPNRL